jgi:hypothetical protein
MMRKIRDLDFDVIIERIVGATDRARRVACAGPIQSQLAFVNSPFDAWCMLRDQLLVATVRHADSFDDVRFDQPIVQALVRAQHHALAEPIPEFELRGGLNGPDVSPHLNAMADAHPELAWDLDAIQELIVRAIRESGEHVLDDSQPPWLMHWDRASAAATALIDLVTLRALGELS